MKSHIKPIVQFSIAALVLGMSGCDKKQAVSSQAPQPIVIDTSSFQKKEGQKKEERKLKIVDSLISKNLKSAVLWVQKAELFLKINKIDSAVLCYEKAVNLDKTNDNTKVTLAYLYAETQNKKTIDLCNHILKSKTLLVYPKAHYIKGVYYVSNGETEKALQSFDNCIKSDWTFIDAYLEKAILLYQKKRTKEAMKILSLAIKVNNKNAETYYWMGKGYEELNKPQEAKNYYRQTLLLDKHFDVARERLKAIEKETP